MGIVKKDPANFNPNVTIPSKVDNFRFWCQKVLPLVYDDSLSYYELLCRLVEYLNNTIDDVNTLATDVDNLNKAYIELQGYVNDYFSTLDVQQEINNKLDEMSKDGTLSNYFSNYMVRQFKTFISVDNVMPNIYIQTSGYYTEHDGGGAKYFVTNTKIKPYSISHGDLYYTLIDNECNANALGISNSIDNTNILQICLDNFASVTIHGGIYKTGTLYINHDIKLNLDTDTILMSTSDTVLKIGETIDGFTSPLFENLIHCHISGGNIDCNNNLHGIWIGKTYHSKIENINIYNFTDNGVEFGGSVGAFCVCENVALRGLDSLSNDGFLIGRSDQLLIGCSVINCVNGFHTTANAISFVNCTAWLSKNNSTKWGNTSCFYLQSSLIEIMGCTVDTLYCGVRVGSNCKSFKCSNSRWINNPDVVPYSQFAGSVFVTDDKNNSGYTYKGDIGDIGIGQFSRGVYLKGNTSGNIIIGNIFGIESAVNMVQDIPYKNYMLGNNCFYSNSGRIVTVTLTDASYTLTAYQKNVFGILPYKPRNKISTILTARNTVGGSMYNVLFEISTDGSVSVSSLNQETITFNQLSYQVSFILTAENL